MRIGIYDPYLDDCGGGEKYMMTIAASLSKTHQVDVFWDHKKDFDNVSRRFSLDLSKVALVPNIFSPQITSFARLLASRKYDGIIVLSDGSIPLVSSKLFLHIQRPLEHIHLSLFDKLKMKRVQRFFCNSQYTKSFIDKTYGIDAEIVYPPVEIHPRKIKKEKVVLHVGRFRVVDRTVNTQDYKKQYVMIKVFKELVDKGLSGWKFILCVSVKEEDQKEFESLCESVKKYPIEFKVNLNNDSLWEYYGKASIYWHASGYGEDVVKHPERAEHFGISTVEAMGSGAVPVVIGVGGQKEIVTDGENGLLWHTLPELKEETLILMNSKEMWEELSENAKKRAMDFGINEFNKKLMEMIKR